MRLVILPGLRVYQHCYNTVSPKRREGPPTTITTQPPCGEQVRVTLTRRTVLIWLEVCGRCVNLFLPAFPDRCVPLSDPAAVPDTPRGRGSQPPPKEETTEQEESLSLFDLPPAAQAVRGGPDRHPGQCRLRGSQLRHPPLTRVPAKPLDSTQQKNCSPSPLKERPTSAFAPRRPSLPHPRGGEREPERPEVGDRTCRQEQWLF